jgi:hypothetical protein
VLYKRADHQNPKWTVRLKVPEVPGFVVKSTKTTDDFEARRFTSGRDDVPGRARCRPSRPPGTLWNARRYSGLMLASLITLARVRRQLKLENRAFVDSPRHPNTAVMAFDNGMADGKANSHATLFGREHRVENMIVVGRVDTRASILDGHVNKIWLANAGSYAQYS